MCQCHRFNLCLQDQWKDEACNDFFNECDAFFRSIGKMLDISSPLQDQLAFYASTIHACQKLKDEIVVVRATAGNTHVGGDDNCIVDFCMQGFTRMHRCW